MALHLPPTVVCPPCARFDDDLLPEVLGFFYFQPLLVVRVLLHEVTIAFRD